MSSSWRSTICCWPRGPVALDELDVVVSHPQPLAQCARTLREIAPRAEAVAASSTAQAVRDVVAAGGARAAIGTAAAARVYGAHVLAEGIEDEPGNATRFVWLARRGDAQAAMPLEDGRHARTSVVFHGHGDGTPGWLVRCLSEFATRGVNLTKIESRPAALGAGPLPLPRRHRGTGRGRRRSSTRSGALKSHCEAVRILGTYAVAGATIRANHGGDTAA